MSNLIARSDLKIGDLKVGDELRKNYKTTWLHSGCYENFIVRDIHKFQVELQSIQTGRCFLCPRAALGAYSLCQKT